MSNRLLGEPTKWASPVFLQVPHLVPGQRQVPDFNVGARQGPVRSRRALFPGIPPRLVVDTGHDPLTFLNGVKPIS
jgi:hypothetical protein